jgi:hypothetical protein
MGQRSDVLQLEGEVRWMGVTDVQKLKRLEEENAKLKRLVADLTSNVNFGMPNLFQCGGACGEGTITSIAAGSHPRQIQFALKLSF